MRVEDASFWVKVLILHLAALNCCEEMVAVGVIIFVDESCTYCPCYGMFGTLPKAIYFVVKIIWCLHSWTRVLLDPKAAWSFFSMSFILILSFISEVGLEGNLMHISLLQDAKLPMLFLEILFKFCKHWALVRGLPEFFLMLT